MNKAYLGDGVYAQNDGYNIILTTENGVSTQQVIYLEPAVITALLLYKKQLEEGSSVK